MVKRSNSRSASSERCVTGRTARDCIIHLMANRPQISLAIFEMKTEILVVAEMIMSRKYPAGSHNCQMN